jgi:Tfp pilus assembly protein PilN
LNLLAPRVSIGLGLAGDDLVVVEASLRGEQAKWTTVRHAGFLAEGAEPIAPRSTNASAPVALVWPLDRLLRRDVALGEQSIDELRVAVAESPDAFFPVGRDEGLLWDAHEFVDEGGVRRAMLFGLRLPEVEPVLSRLAQAGLTPTRIVPSGAAWSLLRYVHDDAPEVSLELGSKGWSVSQYDGLSWNGLQSGFGAAPAELRERARREGWAVCDWRSAPARVGESSVWRPDELTVEHAALGGALLELFRDDDANASRTSAINLLGAAEHRAFRMGPLAWFATACAAAVIGLLVWNDASHARTLRESRELATEIARLAPAVDRVAALREQSAAIIAAHDRLATLEATFRPISAALSELALVVPSDSHLPLIEFADTGITTTVVTPSRTQVMQSIETSPMFMRVMPINSSTRLPGGNEQLGLGFEYEEPASATPSTEGGR